MFRADKKYLVLQPVGGLGNRLAALVSAHFLAIRDERELWVDWITQKGAPKDRFPTPLESLYHVAGARQIDKATWNKARMQRDYTQLSLRDSHVVLGEPCNNQVIVAPLHGRIQSQEDDLRSTWAESFWRNYSLQPQLAKEVSQFRSRGLNEPGIYGLQIRMQGHKRSRAWNPEKKFTQLIRRELQQKPDRKFFVSCDHRPFTDKLQKKYGSTRILSQDKDPQLNTDKALKQSTMDFHLLAACDKLYCSPHSGMSYFAAMIRNEYRQYPE